MRQKQSIFPSHLQSPTNQCTILRNKSVPNRALTLAAEREGAEALVRRASTRRTAERPEALGAATALETWTPAKEEVAAIIFVCCCVVQ